MFIFQLAGNVSAMSSCVV